MKTVKEKPLTDGPGWVEKAQRVSVEGNHTLERQPPPEEGEVNDERSGGRRERAGARAHLLAVRVAARRGEAAAPVDA